MTRTLEVVVTPALLPLYDLKGKTVVVIDILRATTSICVAFHSGAEKILPVSTPEECMLFRDFDFLCAAERDAMKLDGFDMGNSPFEFQNPLIRDRKLAITTTNGTKAIRLSRELGAANILIGSFLNLDALCATLVSGTASIVLVCAGWKDKFNLEDFLFAGAVVHSIGPAFAIDCDSSVAAAALWVSSSGKLEEVVRQSSHAKRFKALHAHEDDVEFCLRMNTLKEVPVLRGEYLVGS